MARVMGVVGKRGMIRKWGSTIILMKTMRGPGCASLQIKSRSSSGSLEKQVKVCS
jgi:hypothetical protein